MAAQQHHHHQQQAGAVEVLPEVARVELRGDRHEGGEGGDQYYRYMKKERASSGKGEGKVAPGISEAWFIKDSLSVRARSPAIWLVRFADNGAHTVPGGKQEANHTILGKGKRLLSIAKETSP